VTLGRAFVVYICCGYVDNLGIDHKSTFIDIVSFQLIKAEPFLTLPFNNSMWFISLI